MSCQTGPEWVPSLTDPKSSVIEQLFSILHTVSICSLFILPGHTLPLSVQLFIYTLCGKIHKDTVFSWLQLTWAFEPAYINLHEWSGNEGSTARMSADTLGGGGPSESSLAVNMHVRLLQFFSLGLNTNARFNNANGPESKNGLQTLEFYISRTWRCSSFVWHMLMIFHARLNLPLQYPGWWTGTWPAERARHHRSSLDQLHISTAVTRLFAWQAGVDPQMVVCVTEPDLRLLAGGRGCPPTVGVWQWRILAFDIWERRTQWKSEDSKRSLWQPWYMPYTIL